MSTAEVPVLVEDADAEPEVVVVPSCEALLDRSFPFVCSFRHSSVSFGFWVGSRMVGV